MHERYCKAWPSEIWLIWTWFANIVLGEKAKGFSPFLTRFDIFAWILVPSSVLERNVARWTKNDIRMLMNAQASEIVSLPEGHSSSSIRKPTVAVIKCTPSTPCPHPVSCMWGGQVLDKYLCHSTLITSRCSSRNPGAVGEVQCKLIRSERRQTRHEEL